LDHLIFQFGNSFSIFVVRFRGRMRIEEQETTCFWSAAMATDHREEALFAAALEKRTPAERAAYLEGACGDDHALRARIESLLAAHDASVDVLDAPPLTTGYTSLTEGPGTIIGPYKLLQQIGEGGMGVVYMAEQQEPVRRKVALKIIKPGMDSYQVIARFEAERQALAMMDHQNIARVLDAGTTASGRPYFVMELVHGVPITKFCDDNKLTPRERLALFVPVCQAIQHAHQKGIIHRDVKPSNVLVTMYDDKPVPKVIDFGVAKAIEQRLTEKTMFTQFGAFVGTFEYMSPEQAEMNAFGVDTRSDVYSLGVVLYELLTGTTPLERKRLREAALDEVVRMIKEEEAPRPSARLSSSQNLPKIAAARKTEPARLSKLVRGEIDWIVMKCLEKDRSRRYDTASGLARDLERHLADEPVEACPPSARYRLSKFARKYKKALVTATAFAALLVAGMVLTTLLAVWATSAEWEANQQRIASDEAKVEASNQRDEARLTGYAAGMNLAQRAWDENDILRARELLDEVPKEVAGRGLRGFEWYYLSRLCHSEEPTFVALPEYAYDVTIQSLAFGPDGQRLALGMPSMLKIHDGAHGRELVSLKGFGFSSVVFSPDGPRVAGGGLNDKPVKVWDCVSGEELLTLKGHTFQVRSVAFSLDGRRLASGSEDGTVKVWDSTTGKELCSGKGHAGAIISLAFSPDGQRLLSGSWDGTVQAWDRGTRKGLVSLEGHFGFLHTLVFSPDGQRLASSSRDGTVQIWDSATGKRLLSVRGHGNRVSSVAFSPDGRRLATGSWDKTVRIWDSATGKELFVFKGHAATVESVAFSPDGHHVASWSMDKTVKIWDTAINRGLFSVRGHCSEVKSAVFSPDGQRLASGGADTVRIWDRATGMQLLSLTGHANWVESVAFSADGQRLASGGSDNTVKIWDSMTGKELFTLKGHAGPVTSVALSPDGQRLASASWDQTIRIWDSVAGRELATLKGHTGLVFSVAFSPDGRRLASASDDQTAKVWDSLTGKELLSLKGHAGAVRGVAFSPDGRRLASGGSLTVKIWDSVIGEELMSLKGHASGVTCVAFSPDGWRLVSGSVDSTVKIWDSTTGKELFSLKGHGGQVHSVTFSPDGHCFASTNRGGSIDLWETKTNPPETLQRRVANQLVAELFQELTLRTLVLERVRSLPCMNPSEREEALAAAQTYPESPYALNFLAWELVKLPGREMSDYRKALSYIEEACRLAPKNTDCLNTLGVAHYRLGNYEKALEVLQLSDEIVKARLRMSNPGDLIFLAMTQQHLGHGQEAQEYLQRMRERLAIDPMQAANPETQSFLREAEALLAKPKTPGPSK
jgi:WD40 repeat protein/serine/threonine protein kinase